MYNEFYSFSENPFNVTPDPKFLFLTASHREALASMIYGINQRKGFISVSGEVGTGKTTLIHHLLQTMDPQIKSVFVCQTHISFEDLLRNILLELDLKPADENRASLIRQLNDYLIQKLALDENLVIFLDEAQNLSREVLEDLRMLSNLETANFKLVQIVFVGQPEFEQMLNTPELRQLKQRIGLRREILPLTNLESRQYIEHRLKLVGSNSAQVFTDEAVALVVRYAEGIPRTINMICDNALLIGYSLSRKRVDEKIIHEVLTDMGFLETKKTTPRPPSPAQPPKLTPLMIGDAGPLPEKDPLAPDRRSSALNDSVGHGKAGAIPGFPAPAAVGAGGRKEPKISEERKEGPYPANMEKRQVAEGIKPILEDLQPSIHSSGRNILDLDRGSPDPARRRMEKKTRKLVGWLLLLIILLAGVGAAIYLAPMDWGIGFQKKNGSQPLPFKDSRLKVAVEPRAEAKREGKPEEIAVVSSGKAEKSETLFQPVSLAPKPSASKPSPAHEPRFKKIIIVQKGDTISSLSRKYFNKTNLSITDHILSANPKITNPDLIWANQKMRLPEIKADSLIIASEGEGFKIHLGTFADSEIIEHFKNEPELEGKEIKAVPRWVPPQETWYRAVVGNFATKEEALRVIEALHRKGLIPALPDSTKAQSG